MASPSQKLSHSTNTDSSSSQASLSSPAINKDWDTVPQTIRNSWAPSDRPGRCIEWYWPHGHDVQPLSEDGRGYPAYFLCRLCLAQKKDDPKIYEESNTGNIESHLREAHDVHHPDPSSKTMRPLAKRALDEPDLRSFPVKKQKTDGIQKESVARIESIDKPTFQRRLVQWATNTNQTFDILEHSELRDVFNLLDPSVKEGSMTLDALRNTILEEVNSLKARVIEALERSPSRVHISFEGQTSEDQQIFFSINAFFLDADSFQPEKVMLGIPDLTTFGTGEDFSGAVANVLKEYKLLSQYNNKVGCFILNDAPDNDRVIEELERALQWQNPSHKKVRFLGPHHVLHHVAQAMLFADKSDAVNNLDPYDFHEWAKAGPVGKLHNLMTWISRSNKARSILESLQVQDSQKKYTGTQDVLLDDNSVWLSQYSMLNRAIELQPYLKELSEILIQASTRSRSNLTQQTQNSLPLCLSGENLLTAADWKALDWFNDILVVLNSCPLGKTNKQYPADLRSCDVLICYQFLHEKLDKARTRALDRPEPSYYSSHIDAAWTEMKKHYAKLNETPVFYAASVLNPFIRWTILDKWNKETEDWLAHARQLIQTLWEGEYRDLTVPWEVAPSHLITVRRVPEEGDYERWLRGVMMLQEERRRGVLSDELEQWLWHSESEAGSMEDDPLEYWSEKRFDYPHVARMALDVLSVPAIATECERSILPAGGLASLNQAQLDTSTTAISRAVRSWVEAGLLDGYDGLLKEL